MRERARLKFLAFSGVIILLCALLPLIMMAPVHSAATTWHVDDDLVDYPAANFTKIQDAVNASSSGDTIIVHAGTYNEDLNVTKGLTLTADSGAKIVGGIWIRDLYTFTDPVTVENFVIKNGTSIDSTHDYGIKISGDIGSGADQVIVDMHITNNTFINCGKTDDVSAEMWWNAAVFFDVNHFGSLGDRYDTLFNGTGEISYNTIVNDLNDSTKRTQLGIGVRSGRNMKINHNNISGNVAEGIHHWGPVNTSSLGNYEINHNHINLTGWIGDSIGNNPRGIWSYAPQSSVSYNTIISEWIGMVLTYWDDTYWGGATAGPNLTLTVNHNFIHPPAGANMSVGLRISGSNGQISENEIYGATDNVTGYGVGLLFEGWGNPEWGERTECSNNTFMRNYIHDNYDSIWTWGSPYNNTFGNTFHYNTIANNTNSGMTNNNDGEIVDARFNFWGDLSGPAHPSNSIGCGDGISDYVDYSPWLQDHFTTIPRTYHVNPTGTIQEAIDEASSGDSLIVHAGTYAEQLTVNENLTLQGEAGTRIAAPDTRNTYSFAESSEVWDPILFAYGGTENNGLIGGSDTIEVGISGFEIDGGNKAVASPTRFVGILCRNVKYGSISNNIVHSMFDPDGKGDGPETFCIMVYGDSDLEIEYNEVRDFSRGGIGVIGDDGTEPDPVATVERNNVTGNGLESFTGWWAENGIELAYGAGGSIAANNVSNCVVNANWAASGIILYNAANGINVSDNTVVACDAGIAVISSNSFDLIDNNVVTKCTWDGIRLGWPLNNCTVINNVVAYNWAGIGIYDASDNIVENNTITDNEYGIYMDGDSHNNTITRNDILNNTADGIHIEPYGVDPSGTQVYFNNIANNTNYGLNKVGSETADARFNWWGDSFGPYHPTTNPSGKGNAVSDNVYYTPWLINSYPSTTAAPQLQIDPPTIELYTPVYGEDFNISINLLEVNDLYGFELKLYWNITLLECVDSAIQPPMVPYYVGRNQINNTVGMYWCAVTGLGNATPFSGNTTLVTLTFQVKHEPVYPQNVSCPIDLSDTIMLDSQADHIPHATSDGEYLLYSTVPKLKVLPEFNRGIKSDEIFVVNITVLDVVNLYSFDVELTYNTTLLKVNEVTVGPFLNEPRSIQKLDIDNILGVTRLSVKSLSPATPVSGNGTIAMITFQVMYSIPWEEDVIALECALSLNSTQLATDTDVVIPHLKTDAIYRFDPIPGDLNEDAIVGLDDLYIVSYAFGTAPGDTYWNPLADVDNNGIVNIRDLTLIAMNYRI